MVLLDGLRDLLAPPRCLACGAAGGDLCGRCRRGLRWIGDPRCERCGLPGRCARVGVVRCPALGQAFDAAWSPVAYTGPAQALVGALKFRGSRIALEPMAAAMARAPAALLDGTEEPEASRALVPVPTARGRVRARGFDHAVELAAALQRRGCGRVTPCLQRGASQARQLGANRAERLAGGRLDLGLHPGWTTAPETCVLVDDVHTTGATLHAAARVLKAAGARRVVALSYARALP